MATPIKDTPVLTGKDARNFDMWLKENSGKKVSNDNYKKMGGLINNVRPNFRLLIAKND